MESSIIEILGGVLLLLLTGGISFMVHLSNRLKVVEKDKVDKNSFEEVRADIKTVLAEIMKLKLENARWEERAKMQRELKHEDS